MRDFPFEPEVLTWARQKAFGPRLATLAENIPASLTEISTALVAEWEKGTTRPNFSQVKHLAKLYRRPLAIFFLSTPPRERENPPDARTIGSRDNRNLSPEALLAIRKARRVQDLAASLAFDLGESPSFKYRAYTPQDDPAAIAEYIRKDLGITTEEQRRSRTYEDFFEALRSKFESAGVLTLKSGLHDSFPIADCRAFSFVDQLPFVILVNNKDYEGAKNFSLAHEFGHILLRQPAICNNFKALRPSRTVSEVEVFCNEFAAHLLVPYDDLVLHSLIGRQDWIDEEALGKIAEVLAKEFKVSRFVIARRLLALEKISLQLYREATERWSDETHPRSGGRFSLVTPFKMNGRAFSSLVFEAYRKKKLSYAGVADYLGIRGKHISAMEKLIA
jgi:Zn-dependent peptidase ImmA (M78 family)